MNNPNVKPKRHAMLGKLFIAAAERGISQEQLRDEIAPGLLKGKRLSAANEKEIALVIEHICGPRLRTPNSGRRYPSSIQGLRDEIKDLAKVRWGEGWNQSLNNLCKKFGIDHYLFLDLRHGKAIKQWFFANAPDRQREPGEEG